MLAAQQQFSLGTFSERFLKESTPSRLDKIDFDAELLYRQKASCLIYDAIVEIRLPPTIGDRAVLLLQHFYMYHSFRKVQYPVSKHAC